LRHRLVTHPPREWTHRQRDQNDCGATPLET
jgi:hypothetical protein